MSGFWPHQFVKDGKEEVVRLDEKDLSSTIKIVPMICVHCDARFVLGQDPHPQGACPARNDKREMKRIKNVG